MSEQSLKDRRCPVCGKPAAHAHRPFCSPRCRDLDLGRWLKGDYAIPATESDDDASPPSQDGDES